MMDVFRQDSVAQVIAWHDGQKTKGIAQEFNLSSATILRHVQRFMRALQNPHRRAWDFEEYPDSLRWFFEHFDLKGINDPEWGAFTKWTYGKTMARRRLSYFRSLPPEKQTHESYVPSYW